MSGQATLQERRPTRVGLTIGSTQRLNEFDFSKIALSLERDLVPAENPIDAYRDIKALLERMVTEFQGTKPVSRGRQESETEQTGTGTPTLPTLKPPSLAVETVLGTVRERLAGWLPDLEITSGLDGFNVKPKRYLGETWANVNEVVRSLGGHWIRGQKPADGSWRIPK